MRLFWLCCISLAMITSAVCAEEVSIDMPASQPQLLSSLPTCEDAKLHELVLDKISRYYQDNKQESLLEKKRQRLIIKNLETFKEILTTDFSRKTNYKVADKILMSKINNGLDDKDLRLCQSAAIGSIPSIYLLIYPENYYYMVDVIDFQGGAQGKSDFFVIYN